MPKRRMTDYYRQTKKFKGGASSSVRSNRVKFRTSQHQPYSRTSYYRWIPTTPIISGTNTLDFTNTDSTARIISIIIATSANEHYKNHDVTVYSGMGNTTSTEVIGSYKFYPTPAQPFMQIFVPQNLFGTRVTMENVSSATNIILYAKMLYSP